MRERFAGGFFGGCSLASLALLGLCQAGCPPKPQPLVACARILAAPGGTLDGYALFEEQGGQVTVRVQVKNAPPGLHGLALHQAGDCADPKGHLNPSGRRHGSPDTPEHHYGDFGNLSVDTDGNGPAQFSTPQLTIQPGDSTVVGRALVVHQNADDFTTQPDGNEGPALGCGVITQVAPGSSNRCGAPPDQK